MPKCPSTPTAYEQAAQDEFTPSPTRLTVVSSCPDCGAPIYGKEAIFSNEKPVIVMSCRCSDDLTIELES